jgi:hypothetical protein
MPLSADDIHRAFGALSAELERNGRHAEIVVAGGAALVLLFRARESTKDVDAYFVTPEASILRGAAEAVARRLDLPDDWLNDSAKGYFVGLTTGIVLYESSALQVRAASTAQLLAMKLAAWRDAVDRGDAKLLLSQLAGSPEEVWAAVKPYVPPHQMDTLKTCGRHFMDLLELVRALLDGDLLSARQFVADAHRSRLDWERLEQPRNVSARELAVAAGVLELLASRAGATAPAWTKAVGAVDETVVLDPGLEKMPRSFARAKAAGPEPLRRRNLIALPDFLDVA